MDVYKEIFKKIYENHNEEVYLKDVVVYLRNAYENIDDKYEVKILLDQFDISGDRTLTFTEFTQVMDDLGRHGWRADTAEESQDMEDVDMKAMFLDADVQRRDSVELLVAPPRRVYNKFNKNMVAKVTGLTRLAAKNIQKQNS